MLAILGRPTGGQALAGYWLERLDVSHHSCLGLDRDSPYSAAGGKKSVNREALDDLKQQIPLMGYLHAQDWRPARPLSRGRWMGLCPLHDDHKPSFLVDANQNLFYCYGCGRGGDVIRFAELYHQVTFPQALSLLREWCGLTPLLHAVVEYYRLQLHRRNEAVVYLDQRGIHSPEVIEHMRIGYAAGGGLRRWLTQLGYPSSVVRSAGLVTEAATTAISGASFFRSKAISMAGAFAARLRHIDSYRERREVCICRSRCVATRR